MAIDKKLNDDAITTHNFLRGLHGCPPLKYDATLAKQAQEYAEKLAKTNKLQHSAATDYGENLATRGGTGGVDLSGAEASQMWYSEIKSYRFRGDDQMECGHFSQLVWKGTHQAGFGIAKAASGQNVYVVGQYRPAGNFMNQWGENVPKPLNGKCSVPSVAEMLSGKPAADRDLPASADSPATDAHAVGAKQDTALPSPDQFKRELIDAQNAFRQQFSVGALRSNLQLDALAQRHAEALHAKSTKGPCQLTYNGHSVGEIVFNSRVKDKSPARIVASWVKKQKAYKGADNVSGFEKTKDFTQMLWAGSTEIGVGMVFAHRPHRTIIVCLYTPSGNTPNNYHSNVDAYLR